MSNYNEKHQALQFNKAINALMGYMIEATNMPEAEIMRYPDLMVKWKAGIALKVGDYVNHGTDENGHKKIYRSTANQVAQQNIPPDSEFNPPYELIGYVNGVRIWVEPLGLMDSYQINDIAHRNGANYKCTLENNRFSPEQFGWEVIK